MHVVSIRQAADVVSFGPVVERYLTVVSTHGSTLWFTRTIEHNAAEPGLVRLFVAMSAESTATDSPRPILHRPLRKLRVLPESAEPDPPNLCIWLRRTMEPRRNGSHGPLPEQCRREDAHSESVAIGALLADGLQIQWLLDSDQVDMGAQLTRLWRLRCRQPETA
jgi:hypothetical protein